MRITSLLSLLLFLPVLSFAQSTESDWRNIRQGDIIPDRSYSDQPYVVQTDDGAWLLTMTTAMGHEGADTQHVTTQRSFDHGKTWQDMVEVESPDVPEASYAVILKDPNSSRVFVFYNFNADNLREIKTEVSSWSPEGTMSRVDSLGYFVFKYSDDHGKSWSDNRITIPVRETEIDRKNIYGGKVRFHWTVGKAFAHKGAAYVPLIKVGNFGEGFFTSNEGVLLRSDDLFTVDDPRKATWETLPEGEIGLRTPEGGGTVAGEQSLSVLSDGSFFVVYRTIDGHPVVSYSRDEGRSWEPPQYMRYGVGHLVKNPRSANFAWKCENGKFLYWFNNNGGRWLREHPEVRILGYRDRNPAWVLGGREVVGPNGKLIEWSQPEILLYDDDPIIRMSYPDLIEDDGKYFITETQKDVARVHELDPGLLEALWGQFDNKNRTKDGLLEQWDFEGANWPQKVESIELEPFYVRDPEAADKGGKHIRSGFTWEMDLKLDSTAPGQLLIDTRDEWRQGMWLETTATNSLRFSVSDGRTVSSWESDQDMIQAGQTHHVSVIVDGGPKIIMFVIDGILNDGGDSRRFGWGRFNAALHHINGVTDHWTLGTNIVGQMNQIYFYNRALKVSEAIGNYRNTKD